MTKLKVKRNAPGSYTVTKLLPVIQYEVELGVKAVEFYVLDNSDYTVGTSWTVTEMEYSRQDDTIVESCNTKKECMDMIKSMDSFEIY